MMRVKSEALHSCSLLLKEIDLLHRSMKLVTREESTYNIISLLRQSHDEVNVHSRIIHDLLNPVGTHGMDAIFLELFLKVLDIKGFDLGDATVSREYKNIDIYITNGRQSIIIENKIYSQDRDRQIERYYNKISSEGIEHIFVIYLSLHGNDPDPISVGKLDKNIITCASYERDIAQWLEMCMKESYNTISIKEPLRQYQTIIRNLTGGPMNNKYTDEIGNLLLQDKNLKYAIDVKDGIGNALTKIQLSLWDKIYKEMKKRGYEDGIHNAKSWSEDIIENYYQGKRETKHYGSSFHVLNIDKRAHVEYRIEIERAMYHGFIVVDASGDNVSSDDRFQKCKDIVKNVDDRFRSDKWWLGWRHESRQIDFVSFKSDDAMELVSEEGRNDFVSRLIEEIDSGIKSFISEINRGDEMRLS